MALTRGDGAAAAAERLGDGAAVADGGVRGGGGVAGDGAVAEGDGAGDEFEDDGGAGGGGVGGEGAVADDDAAGADGAVHVQAAAAVGVAGRVGDVAGDGAGVEEEAGPGGEGDAAAFGGGVVGDGGVADRELRAAEGVDAAARRAGRVAAEDDAVEREGGRGGVDAAGDRALAAAEGDAADRDGRSAGVVDDSAGAVPADRQQGGAGAGDRHGVGDRQGGAGERDRLRRGERRRAEDDAVRAGDAVGEGEGFAEGELAGGVVAVVGVRGAVDDEGLDLERADVGGGAGGAGERGLPRVVRLRRRIGAGVDGGAAGAEGDGLHLAAVAGERAEVERRAGGEVVRAGGGVVEAGARADGGEGGRHVGGAAVGDVGAAVCGGVAGDDGAGEGESAGAGGDGDAAAAGAGGVAGEGAVLEGGGAGEGAEVDAAAGVGGVVGEGGVEDCEAAGGDGAGEGDAAAAAAGERGRVAEKVLKAIQLFDPVGVAARTLEECLMVQAQQLGVDDEILTRIITDHLGNLEKKNYQAIARDLKEPVEEIYEAAKVIMQFDPRPGREFTAEDPLYITPDVFIHKVGDKYFVVPNDDGLPKLKISNFYQAALKGTPKAREYVQEKLRSAQWLIRSIQQRQRTIVKVTESIIKFQRDFFDRGIDHLKPLILRDVAEDINMHESTISRVTTNKYVHTPQGIFELKFFFNSGIKSTDGDEVASEAVKTKIKQIIAAEDPRHPLSDQRIVELLKDQTIDIARRTVAKYREQLGILSSSKRKQLF